MWMTVKFQRSKQTTFLPVRRSSLLIRQTALKALCLTPRRPLAEKRVVTFDARSHTLNIPTSCAQHEVLPVRQKQHVEHNFERFSHEFPRNKVQFPGTFACMPFSYCLRRAAVFVLYKYGLVMRAIVQNICLREFG